MIIIIELRLVSFLGSNLCMCSVMYERWLSFDDWTPVSLNFSAVSMMLFVSTPDLKGTKIWTGVFFSHDVAPLQGGKPQVHLWQLSRWAPHSATAAAAPAQSQSFGADFSKNTGFTKRKTRWLMMAKLWTNSNLQTRVRQGNQCRETWEPLWNLRWFHTEETSLPVIEWSPEDDGKVEEEGLAQENDWNPLIVRQSIPLFVFVRLWDVILEG